MTEPGTQQLPNYTSFKRSVRRKHARNWEYEQYEPHRHPMSFEHNFLEYSAYQFQHNLQGVRYAHGYLRFSKTVTYAAVHALIGGGNHCHIFMTRDPVSSRDRCYDPNSEHFTQVTGTFSKPRRTSSRDDVIHSHDNDLLRYQKFLVPVLQKRYRNQFVSRRTTSKYDSIRRYKANSFARKKYYAAINEF